MEYEMQITTDKLCMYQETKCKIVQYDLLYGNINAKYVIMTFRLRRPNKLCL